MPRAAAFKIFVEKQLKEERGIVVAQHDWSLDLFTRRGAVRRGSEAAGLSRSVTATRQIRVLLLQIEMLSWLPDSLS